MQNGGHCATGCMTGAGLVAVSDAAGFAALNPSAYVVYIIVTAGAALWPDIDHQGSMFTTSGGDLTGSLSKTLQGVARGVHWLTSGPHDNHNHGAGEHRGFLHTWPCAVLVGVGIWWGTTLSPWVGPVALVLIFAPAIRSLSWILHDARKVWIVRLVLAIPAVFMGAKRRRRSGRVPWWLDPRSVPGAWIAAVLATVVITKLYGWELYGPMFALSIIVGMVTHDCGDAATTQGAPLSWPVKRRCRRCAQQGKPRCQRWTRCFVLPGFARWSVGDPHTPEPFVTWASLIVAGVVIAYGIG